MAAVTAEAPPRLQPLLPGTRMTVEEFEAYPDELLDESYRYELLAGVVCVSSAPGDLHQVAVKNLVRLLDDAVPHELVVIAAGGVVDDRSGLIPDVFLRRRQDFGDRRGRPPLVVEVLSPSTRTRDRTSKRRLYAEMGVGSYWVVDVDEPSVLVLELQPDGHYYETAEVAGDRLVAVRQPFDLTFRPVDLVTY